MVPDGRPYRAQRITVPPADRARFLGAATASFGLFAIMGPFTSLAPSLLRSLGQASPLVGGLAAFLVFAAAASAQILLRTMSASRQIAVGLGVTAAGMLGLAAAVAARSAAGFLLGGLVAGAGAGVLRKGALGTAAALAPAGSRGEEVAGIFLGGYAGLVVPVLGVGIANAVGVPQATSFLGFAAGGSGCAVGVPAAITWVSSLPPPWGPRPARCGARPRQMTGCTTA